METIRATGKTLEDAIESAKVSLKCSIEQMEYQILEEGSKGILGFGAKPVVISATKKQEEMTEKVKKLHPDCP